MSAMNRQACFLPLALLLALGCSSNSQTPARVSGKVVYNGQPVSAGTISFHRIGAEQAGAYTFPLQADGAFSGTGMPAEEMVVTVETESANPKHVAPTYSQPGQKGGNSPTAEYDRMMREKGNAPIAGNPGEYVKIPQQYGDKSTSPLRQPLKNGKNELTITLTDDVH